MGSKPAEANTPVRAEPGSADLLASAASLRWVRPDLTAELADHVLRGAAASEDRDGWLCAAGWAVHARSTTGDGRETAAAVLDESQRWGGVALTQPAAHRLRVELAVVAIGAGRTDRARALLTPVVVAGGSSYLWADALTATARCAVEDAPSEVASALRNARSAWKDSGGADWEIGSAAVDLVAAAAYRRAAQPAFAADAARSGLIRLEGSSGAGHGARPHGHLEAALTAEWISALLDDNRVDEARQGCERLLPWLGEPGRPSRQLARLWLTVARATTPGAPSRLAADILERAARDAADSNSLDLEIVSRTALARLLEQSGQSDAAREALRLAELAERRDRQRDRLFQEALAAAATGPPTRVADSAAVSNGAESNGAESNGAESNGAESSMAGDGGHLISRTSPTLRLLSRRERPTGAVAGHGIDRGQRAEPNDPAVSSGPSVAGMGPDPQRNDSSGDPRRGQPAEGPSNGRAAMPYDRAGHEGGTGAGISPAVELTPVVAPTPAVAQWPWVDVPAMSEDDHGGQDLTTGNTPMVVETEIGAAVVVFDGREGAGTRPAERDPDVDQGARRTGSDDHAVERLWRDRSGESPIGDLLMQSLRTGRPDEVPTTRPDTEAQVDRPADPLEEAHASVPRGAGRQIDDPWRTGSWAGVPRDDNGSSTASPVASGSDDATAAPLDRTVDHSPAPAASRTAGSQVEPASVDKHAEKMATHEQVETESTPGGPSDQAMWLAPDGRLNGRLHAALADLDRAWGLMTGGSAGEGESVSRTRTEAEQEGREPVPSGPSAGSTDLPDSGRKGSDTRPDSRSDGWQGTASPASGGIAGVEPSRPVPLRHASIPAAADPFGPRTVAHRYALGHDVTGCLIAIDVARDGRRFAGRRASGVLRAVADRLTGHLPSGARLHDDRDALAVLVPDADGLSITGWMHRTLPGLLEDLAVEDDLVRLQLRSVVYGSDGPVGAQLLLRLDGAPAAAGSAGSSILDHLEQSPSWRRDAAVPAVVPDGVESLGSRTDEAQVGRHDATGRTPFRLRDERIQPGNGGRRHRAEPATEADGRSGPAARQQVQQRESEITPSAGDPTEGMGLADLLAGALAAYRGI